MLLKFWTCHYENVTGSLNILSAWYETWYKRTNTTCLAVSGSIGITDVRYIGFYTRKLVYKPLCLLPHKE